MADTWSMPDPPARTVTHVRDRYKRVWERHWEGPNPKADTWVWFHKSFPVIDDSDGRSWRNLLELGPLVDATGEVAAARQAAADLPPEPDDGACVIIRCLHWEPLVALFRRSTLGWQRDGSGEAFTWRQLCAADEEGKPVEVAPVEWSAGGS